MNEIEKQNKNMSELFIKILNLGPYLNPKYAPREFVKYVMQVKNVLIKRLKRVCINMKKVFITIQTFKGKCIAETVQTECLMICHGDKCDK